MRLTLLLLLGAILLSQAAHAEFNFTFPRARFYSELGRPTSANSDTGGRPRPHNALSLKDQDSFGIDSFRAGASSTYATRYLWREYVISESGKNYAADAFVSFMGAEADVFALWDTDGAWPGSGPLEMDYRASYSHKLDTSINTIAYTYRDFGDAAAALGTRRQNFPAVTTLDSRHQELSLSSYWFGETIQRAGADPVLGIEAAFNSSGGVHGQLVIGYFGGKPVNDIGFVPNAARAFASLDFQSKYFSETSSFPGSNFLVEGTWDFRQASVPLSLNIGFEYFYAWGDDLYRDSSSVMVRLEYAWP